MKRIPIRIKKSTACVLLATFLFELLTPAVSYALTSGPSQPEMQSFEPVGTTDMVNAFSGDFTYNIPLLDVEGYPINIAYHSGPTIEQEASWVGLGWNINPGNINHGVRGLPDDFNGEKIQKEIKINEEVTKRFGMFFELEVAGLGLGKGMAAVAKMLKMNMGGQVNMGVNVSNYTGVSSSLSTGTDVGIKNNWFSAGVNMGATFSTDNGMDINASANAGFRSKAASGLTSSVNGSFGKAYNSREGLKYTSFGVNPSFGFKNSWQNEKGRDYSVNVSNARPEGVNNTIVPISMQNFVPVITNASFMESNFFQFKMGIETTATIYPNFGGSYGQDNLKFDEDGTRAAYGYFNLQNATKDDITDFTRDRDGQFNRDMQYLPSGNMTYDVYAVNGQGTAGNFRGFRNDIGTVYDPYTNSDNKASNNLVELGVGNIFEAGWDHVSSFTSSSSGPWNSYKNGFSKKKAGSLYEPHFFKQAGELTEASNDYTTAIGGTKPLSTAEMRALKASPLEAPGITDNNIRSKRANLLYYFTAEEASNGGVSLDPAIPNYPTAGNMAHSGISRTSGGRKAYHASEFTQLLPDGRRYIYGIPAMNKEQMEYVVSCGDAPSTDGTINISTTSSNPRKPYTSNPPLPVLGQDFFMKTSTPAYAHSYLLTNILSPDYSDLTGDGISDDDLGSYTKFNYTRKDSNYRWRTPYATGSAQYDKGVLSDCHDDKATFMIGSKEIWMLHSVESKNYQAEFYTSAREDARGAGDNIGLVGGATAGVNYKLDSIVLYNKRERQTAGNSAVPIKRVLFSYDYSLCKGLPNSTAATHGKLTLKAISIKFGNSDIGLLSPYRFAYNSNPDYKVGGKDMWGNFKEEDANASTGFTGMNNHDFPYVRQHAASANQNASAWNLSNIKLPSGGAINVSYEADDYSYVQDRKAMEMFKVEGVGPDSTFVRGNSLYQSQTNPYLYVYFKRKKDGNGAIDEWYNNVRKAYLDNGDLIQYNFKVKMSSNGEMTPSCGIPLEDHVKGYAGVEDMGVCDDRDYGYVKLSPKDVTKMPSLSALDVPNLKLNPVTLTSIFYARYYNSKALYPSSEILSTSDPVTLIKQLLSSFMEITNYFRSPITKYLNDGRAKYVDLDQSYIRLCSQGHKLGGGHRVKRIEFTDNWDQVSSSGQPVAVYGSDYDYAMADDATGKMISSGVATYEPLYGGDENPFKEPIATDRIGQKRDFPVVIPTELTMEGPIGEAMYPSPDVGYSKVTVTSIHKSEGQSSQTILEHEFYTARDFPIRTANTDLEKLEDKKLKAIDLSLNKREVYRVGQGYSLFFNDMHGKPKKETVWVAKGGDARQLVSYKKYDYYTNPDKTLNNKVPCAYAEPGSGITQRDATLGVETDLMLDSREKIEKTNTKGFMANLNVFMGPAFPIPIPSGFPKFPKSMEKTFSSVVCTKVIQQYGILKSVETFDKGAAVTMSNLLFDPTTGLPLVTKVNTEHNDNELQVKYPAYWAYRCMGPAYKNILYDEDLKNKVSIVNDTCFIFSDHPDRFNIGDELLFTLKSSCAKNANATDETFKLWVVDKDKTAAGLPTGDGSCDCSPIIGTGYSLSNQALPDGVNDPRYFYSYDGINYSPAITTWHPWNPTLNTPNYVPWITGSNYYQQGITYIKTIIYATDDNKDAILLSASIDGYESDPNSPCPSCRVTNSSAFYVNGQSQSMGNGYFHPAGLVAGQNTIIWKLCNCTGQVAMSTSIIACPPRQHAIAAIPLRKAMPSATGSFRPFPNHETIYDATVKVIRSGRRNQLQETVQDLSLVDNTGSFNYNNGGAYTHVLNAEAQTFTDVAAASPEIADPATTYYNPFVTGRRGNYRLLAKYNINQARDYSAAIDPGKGIMNSVNSFWKYSPAPDNFTGAIIPDAPTQNKWFAQSWVRLYSPWGNDLEVQDAAGNIRSTIFGYGNTLPVATVNNGSWDNALYENFEDYSAPATVLNFYQNDLNRYLHQSSTSFNIGMDHHTGMRSLNVAGMVVTSLPVYSPFVFASNGPGVSPFRFQSGKKYIVSYWQKAGKNAVPASYGQLSMSVANTVIQFYPKTPNIDGWVMYEGELMVPFGQYSYVGVTIDYGVLDDLRIVPVEANMKCYVYHPVTRKLSAILDENHMASFFEYDAEGKLVRVKKETEKGILTLKESRGSLHNALNTANGNGTLDLKY